MYFFPEGRVGLVPKRVCLLTLAYYAFPRWYDFGEWRSNVVMAGENQRTQRETCPSATLSTTNPTCIDPGANPGLWGERAMARPNLYVLMAGCYILTKQGLRRVCYFYWTIHSINSPHILCVRQSVHTANIRFKKKVKQSLYTPWRRLGGEEV
jgi:hypothetical protein